MSLSAPPDTVPAKILLLGLGNDLLTDDAVGLHVAAEVGARLKCHPGITVLQSSEMGLGLLDLVLGFETLIIVDAIQTKAGVPGCLHELSECDLESITAISPHFVGVAELLALGRQLGLMVPSHLKIFAVEVEDPFTLGTHMTSSLNEALPEIVRRVYESCETLAQPA